MAKAKPRKTDVLARDDDQKPHEHTVYLRSDDGDLEPILSQFARARKIRVGGVDYEHTHDHSDGAWIYRAL